MPSPPKGSSTLFFALSLLRTGAAEGASEARHLPLTTREQRVEHPCTRATACVRSRERYAHPCGDGCRWVEHTFPAPREPAAVRRCQFYVYEHMPYIPFDEISDQYKHAAGLEEWLWKHAHLARTETLRDPNLVIRGMGSGIMGSQLHLKVSHIFLLHALLKHPKRTTSVRDATFFYVPLGERFLDAIDAEAFPAADAQLAQSLYRENPQWESGVKCHLMTTQRPSKYYFGRIFQDGTVRSPMLNASDGALAGMQVPTLALLTPSFNWWVNHHGLPSC
jgi:hypothetical protein